MANRYKLAVVGGDGIGPEVTAEALKVLRAATPDVIWETTDYDLGARRYHRTGETLPDSVLEEIRAHDAILLGAIGDPTVPSGVLERGLLLRLRFELDHYVNLRPVRLYPGIASPLAKGTPGDDRHGRRPRGHRGPVHRGGRRDAPRHAAGTGHPGVLQHRVRRGAGRPVRVQRSPRGGRGASSRWCTRPTC